MNNHDVPIKFSEALYLAAEIARHNELMEAELTELRMNMTKDVLRGPDIVDLCSISKSTLSEWAQDPTFPHLRGDWAKGMAIMCKSSELYQWLKNRKSREINHTFKSRKLKRHVI